jgi:predicted ribosome quality control (RQC) complex YloA/Tae2 family protein
MDIFLLQALIDEMSPWIVGRSVGRIDQLGATDLLLDLHLRDGRRLHLSTDPQRLACYLTDRTHRQFSTGSRSDTPMVALLKKHLEGRRLREVIPLGYDRVVRFVFTREVEAPEEEGEDGERTLVLWLTGRSANIWLLADGEVLTLLREREGRGEGPGYTDPRPPGDRLDPTTCPAELLRERLAREAPGTPDEPALAAGIERSLIGFTPRLSRELAFRLTPPARLESVWPVMQAQLFPTAPGVTLYSSPTWEELQREPARAEMQLTLSVIPLTHLSDLCAVSFASANEAMSRFQTFLDERAAVRALQQRIQTHLTTRRRKLEALLANLDRETAKYAKTEQWQRQGELLLANAHQAILTENGTFLVVNFFDETEELVEIDTAGKKEPQEAAEHYFRLARKGRHARSSIEARRPAILAELQSLHATRNLANEATSHAPLEALALSLGLAAPLTASPAKPPAAGRPPEKREAIPGVRRYRSSDGFEILVGRTDRDNDHLTNRIARSHDLWLHAADYPGSHVILRNPRRLPIPFRSLQEAAQLAAKFSQAREAPKVAVHYCEKKFVTKPKGFPPGQVRLASFKTILVEPGEPAERLLAN